MNRKRTPSLLLALLMLFCLMPAFAAADDENPGKYKYLTDYNDEMDMTNVESIIYAAETALRDEAPPAEVKKEMYAVADEFDLRTSLDYAVANMAAFETDNFWKMVEYCGLENQTHELNFWETPSHSFLDESGVGSAFGLMTYDEAMLNMLKDPKAQYCFDPCFWSPDGFKSVFGTEYNRFQPSAPRPGYAAVILKPGIMADCSHKWSEEADGSYELVEAVNSFIDNVMGNLGADDCPVFTGNPNLASTFWVFDLQYPFHSWYGDNSFRVKGFNCTFSVSVIEAKTKREIASLSATEKLESTIYYWNDDDMTSQAERPYLEEQAGFDGFVKRVREALQKEYSLSQADRRIIRSNAKEIIDGVLMQRAERTPDDWQKAILRSGAQDIAVEADSVSFKLRGFKPTVNGAYAQAEDPRQWLQDALAGTAAYDLEVKVPMQDRKITQQGLSAIDRAVSGAANEAKRAFSQRDLQTALGDYLFPKALNDKPADAAAFAEPSEALRSLTDAHDGAFPNEASIYAPLFYAQKNRNYNINKGPHEILIYCTGAVPESLCADAFSAALDKQAYLAGEDRVQDESEAYLIPGAVALGNYKTEQFTVTVDIDDLLADTLPESYLAYLSRYTFEEASEKFFESLSVLPDEAALSLPANGVTMNPGNGVNVSIRLPREASPTYVRIRNFYSEEVVAIGFVHPGKQIDFRVPRADDYQICWCSGPYWYGEELLFGDLGNYSKTEEYSINNNVILTLQTVESGDINVYRAGPGDFQ